MIEVSLDRDALATALDHVAPAADPKSTIPILGNVLIELRDDEARFTCTDLDRAAVAVMPYEAEAEGAATVPVTSLRDLVRRTRKGATIELSQENGRITFRAGPFAAKLATLPAEDFPPLASLDDEGQACFELPGNVLASALDLVTHAAANEETRYYLNGVCMLAVGGSLALCATDGHRLCEARVPVAQLSEGFPGHGVIVPRAALKDLRRMATAAGDDRVMIVTDGRRLTAATGNGLWTVTRLVDGQFPAYERVIPKACAVKLTLDREAVIEAVKRAVVLSRDGGLRFEVGRDAVEIVARGDQGEARERLEAEADGEMEVGYNARYLLDMLGVFSGDSITLGLNGPSAPALVEAEAAAMPVRYVLMPMRI